MGRGGRRRRHNVRRDHGDGPHAAAVYFNSVPGGTVFLENCCNTVGDSARRLPGFVFRRQTVFARQFNPERVIPQVVNDGSDL
ncbi:MAG: hypothetical protein AAF800_13575 [Planctomycetota bacterium]